MLLKSTAFLAIFVILVSGEAKPRESIVEKEKRHHEHEEGWFDAPNESLNIYNI